MRGALLVFAAVLYLGGSGALFGLRTARGRILGLACLAAGGLVALAALGPGGGAVVVVAAVSAVTLTGLLLVARAMERTGRREGGSELRIDVDPLRWP